MLMLGVFLHDAFGVLGVWGFRVWGFKVRA